MKCESVRAQLTAYLDGELEGDRGSAVRGHLRGCEACRGMASDEAALRDGLRSLPPLDPPASLWAGVQRQLAAAEVADAERPAWRRVLARWAPKAPTIGLAGAVVAAAIVLVVVKTQQDDDATTTTATNIPPVEIKSAQPLTPPAPAPAPRDDVAQDVTAELAAEPAAITASYASTVRDLLAVANEARASWPDDKKREFDAQVAALQKKAALATDERPRRESYRKLIRYLQRTVIHDDVALASTGGTP
jgi:anti-sigma factor RsiW